MQFCAFLEYIPSELKTINDTHGSKRSQLSHLNQDSDAVTKIRNQTRVKM